jgi:hypothetical protein
MYPFVVSYGFEDNLRLTKKFKVPSEVISKTPAEFAGRLFNALNLSAEGQTLQDTSQKIVSIPFSNQHYISNTSEIARSRLG